MFFPCFIGIYGLSLTVIGTVKAALKLKKESWIPKFEEQILKFWMEYLR